MLSDQKNPAMAVNGLKCGWIELMEPSMPSLYYHLETFQSGFNLVFRSINLGVL